MSRHPGPLSLIVRSFFAERKAALLLGMVLSLTTAIAGVALLGISGWFIAATSIAGLSAAASLNVFTPSATIRLLAIGRTLTRYGERLTTHDVTLRILAAIRQSLFLGWATPSAARYLKYQPSKLLYRLTADIDALEIAYLRILVPAFAALGTTCIVVVALWFLNPWLGMAAGVWLLGSSLGVLLVASRAAGKHARRRACGVEAIRSRTIDLVAGQTELVMAGQLGAQCAAVGRADRYAAEADDALGRLDAMLIFLFGASATLLVAGTLMATAGLAQSGAIGTPAAVFGLIVVLTATEQFAPLRRGVLELGRTVLSARRISPRLRPRPVEASIPEPCHGDAVDLVGVTAFHQDTSVAAVGDIDLQLGSGEILAVVGASGSGKSSLLGVLAGELPARLGRIQRIDAALMTQRTELFEGTIRANLQLARPVADDRLLLQMLAAAGLSNEIAALPAGLDTCLGEGGCGLSGGQSRRLVLARFFLRNAALWLLDEPTEGLDSVTARDVIRQIRIQAEGHSVVIATHLRREAAFADRIAVMEEGRIVQLASRGDVAFLDALDRLRPD